MWLSTMRRDIAYAAKELSKRLHAPTAGDQARCKRTLRYIAGTMALTTGIYPRDGDFQISAFADADLGGCADTGRSTSGGVVLLNGSIIHAWSKQQGTVALSSAEAEYVAVARAASEVLFVENWLGEMWVKHKQSVIETDSRSASDMCRKRVVGRVKHLDRSLHFVRELVQSGRLCLRSIPGADNIADTLTKHVTAPVLQKLRPALLGCSE